MIEFTPEAQTIWQQYVSQVRKYLSISKTPEPEEIISDLNEHIQQELQGISAPVSPRELEEVLKRLGSPRQWVPEEDLPWWRHMILRLRTGPEDWRLAYLSLGVLVLGAPLLGPVGLFCSFCLSRGALVVSEESEIQAKKWLIYPSLLIVYCLLAPVLFLWPVIPATLFVFDLFHRGAVLHHAPLFDHDGLGTFLAVAAAIAVGLALWWTVLLFVVWCIVRGYWEIC